ncbi:MAG: type IV pilus assembly protein PilM, partial [Planctomycetota bacterium]|nr:type IV pilus assembly protein PilM [Planctomycetota bacterium]
MLMEQSCWGIDIGRSSLKAVKLRRVGEKVELADVAVLDYLSESEQPPGATEIRQALAEFRARKKVGGGETVAVALPGYTMFLRFIKLPAVETKKFEDVVKYEAASQIPFPMTDVMWSYYRTDGGVTGGETAGETEVGIFAVKHDVIKNYLENFDAAGVNVDIVTAAPLALYNFSRFEMDIPEQVVLVDIGADHSDLVIMDGRKFYVRNLTTAGNDITKALQDEFKLTFQKAEQLKIKVGKSKQAEKVFAVIQPILRSLVDQISRSIGYYRQQTGSNVEFSHLVLLGNATRLEGLPQYFSENLGMRIHDFFDIVNIELSRDLARDSVRVEVLKEHLPSLAVAMGLALQGLGKGLVDANFLPTERRAERAVAKKRPAIIAAVGLVFLLLLFISMTYGGRASALRGVLEDRIKPRIEELVKTDGEVKKSSDYGDWAARVRQLNQFAESRLLPLRMLNDFNSAVTSSELRFGDYPARLEGRRYNEIYDELRDEMKKLNRTKMWLLSLRIEAKEEREAEEKEAKPSSRPS